MKTGLEVLLSDISKIKKERLGIITNPTGIDSNFNHIVELLLKAGCNINALFSPEHGLWGTLQDQIGVKEFQDIKTGITCYSLYGNSFESLSPTYEMLKDIDTLIFDIQDIGIRYYTYIYTMALSMIQAKKYDKKFIVLDRPNPISGKIVEGNILKEKFKSFVGLYPLPVRHGMTVGELAFLFNKEFNIGCTLEVIKMEGWKREEWFDNTNLPWVLPSPNMPTLDTALVYGGSCLIEGTNLSEGRGTTKPFEIIGAPFINPWKLTEKLEEENLLGVKFRPLYFRPTFHKWKNQDCGGVQIHVTNRSSFKSYITGIAIIKAVFHLYPENFEWRKEVYEFSKDILAIDMLTGDDNIKKMIEDNLSIWKIEKTWQIELKKFMKIREKYLLY